MKQKFVFQWHITSKCNLRCRHCYQEDYNMDLTKEELKEIFYDVKDFFQKHSFCGHINFTGGEPFAHKDALWMLLNLCTDNNISFGILTNGTMIDEKTVKQLRKYKRLRFVQISIDGIEETHDNIRGNGMFQKAMKGIRLLKNENIQTMVSFTCGKANQKELKKVIRVCEKNGVDRFWTDRLVPIGSNELEVVSTNEYKEYLKVLDSEHKRAKMLPWVHTQIHTNRALQFVCGDGNGYKCSAGTTLLTIQENGDLLPCRRLPLVLGNLKEGKIEEITSNHPIIETLKNNELDEDCKKCDFKEKCNGGAKCLTYAMTRKLSGKDVNCFF